MTASGRPFWPLEPRVEDIDIEDIAHHLSHQCRFSGAVRAFYSVAQHSVLVSKAMKRVLDRDGQRIVTDDHERGLYGLLHDASEAYLIDVPRPLKHDPQFSRYRDAEARLQALIYARFGLDPAREPEDLHVIDRRMLRTEQRDLMPPPALDERRDDVPPFQISVTDAWWPLRAKVAFLARFCELTGAELPPLHALVGRPEAR
jgi:hypothetical protein